MPLPHFIKDDDELMRLHLLGRSSNSCFIYNDYSGNVASGLSGNVLHRAGCPHVGKSNTRYQKVFFNDLDMATRWICQQRGDEGKRWRRCSCCKSEHQAHGSATPTPSPLEATTRKQAPEPKTPSHPAPGKEPFTEGKVEDLLQPWLEAQGYSVEKRVRVGNGIIDVVAHRSDSEWVIEAKGEDKGGFGTAEMNFRIGIAQICSRMEHKPGRRFALAIPLTADFQRLLRKHRDFTVFERMEIWLFVANSDGEISLVSPEQIQGFVDGL